MADIDNRLLSVLDDLIKTPNGQVRTLGGIMAIGSAYYILHDRSNAYQFAYATLILGVILVLVSAWMATVAEKYKSNHEQRRRARDTFEPSERLVEFNKEILIYPRTKQELLGVRFSGYNDLDQEQLYAIATYETARACVITGLATYEDGYFRSIDTTLDRTVINT